VESASTEWIGDFKGASEEGFEIVAEICGKNIILGFDEGFGSGTGDDHRKILCLGKKIRRG
jgi:hypothetical protein